MPSDLERVRELLLGNEYDELLRLKSEFRDDALFAEHVSHVITEALKRRAGQDDSVASVLAPAIDGAIAGSINQDPHKLAESLYPIMGPAIRKSISETLQQMLENFNQLLEQSLSPQSLGWRFDAWRTGRSYSELVLLNTLEFRIEQVFLVHRESSLLISHVFDDLAERKDPDMVSSMFSAIQDFIEDSFSTAEGDVLDTLRLGELNVVIQRGPKAVVAAVVRGRIPEELRQNLAAFLESVHITKHSELQDYAGTPEVFADTETDLRSLLESRVRTDRQSRKPPLLALIVIAVLLTGAGYWQYQSYQRTTASAELVSRLDAEPGITVLETQAIADTLQLVMLIDPLSTAPDTVPFDSELITPAFILRPHISLHPEIISRRAHQVLKPPESVRLNVDGTTLHLSGSTTVQWLEQALASWPAVTGVTDLETADLDTYNPLADELEETIRSIEAIEFEFPKEADGIDPAQPVFRQLLAYLKQADRLARTVRNQPIRFHIVGYTDDTGSVEFNERLGLKRADNLFNLLKNAGIRPETMSTFSGLQYEQLPVAERKIRIIIQDDQS